MNPTRKVQKNPVFELYRRRMSADGSFDSLLARVRAGDERGASRIYQRFAGRLIAQARNSLPHGLRAEEDPEDAALASKR